MLAAHLRDVLLNVVFKIPVMNRRVFLLTSLDRDLDQAPHRANSLVARRSLVEVVFRVLAAIDP
jgi:hypothetical protein